MLVDISEETNELKAALTILLKLFAGSVMGGSLLLLSCCIWRRKHRTIQRFDQRPLSSPMGFCTYLHLAQSFPFVRDVTDEPERSSKSLKQFSFFHIKNTIDFTNFVSGEISYL